MTRLIRTLSLLVCMALLMTSLPVNALAEPLADDTVIIAAQQDAPVVPEEEVPAEEEPDEETAAPAGDAEEQQPADAPAELEVEFLMDEEELLPEVPVEAPPAESVQPEAEGELSEEAEEEAPAPEAEQEAVIAVDYTLDAGKNPTFLSGYAEIGAEGASVYETESASAPLFAQIDDGVVYAITRSSEPDRLQFAYNNGDTVVTGWADVAQLRPMDPETEVPNYIQACGEDDAARSYRDAAVLLPVDCSYPRTAEETEEGMQEMTFLTVLAELGSGDGGEPGDEPDDEPVDPTPVTLSEDSLKLSLETTYDILNSGIIASAPADAVYTFETSNEGVASVDEAGVITAVSTGKAFITITAYNGSSALLEVRCYPIATEMAVIPEHSVLGAGMSTRVEVFFPEFSEDEYSLSCEPAACGSVDASGLVYAGSAGELTVTATTAGGVTASAVITVLPAPDKILIQEAPQKVYAGETVGPIIAAFAEGTMCGLVYESLNTEVAGVDANGNVTGVSKGEAVIRVSASNNPAVADEYTVVVVNAPETLTLSKSSITIGKNDTFDINEMIQLAPADAEVEYTYASSKSGYVSVSKEGVVKGVKNGSANITVKTQNGLSAKLKVTVKTLATAAKLKLSPAEQVLGVGGSGAVKVSFTSGYAGLCKFESTVPGVAEVDGEGNITAIAPGKTDIIVSLAQKSSVYKTVSVQVAEVPGEISASVPGLVLGVGQVSDALFGVNNNADTICSYIYKTGNDRVVLVDEITGRLTAVGAGEAEITIAANNNPAATAKCTVKVLPAAEDMSVRSTSVTIGKGDTFDMMENIVLPEGSAAGYTFSTSKKTVATVGADGVVKGVKAGSANITVKTHNGLSATVKVTVKTLATAKKMSISPTKLTLGENSTGKLTAKFSSGYYGLHEWSSDNHDAVTIDANGNITAHNPGKATIKLSLKAKPSVSKTATVTVLAKPETIGVSRGSLTMAAGQTSTAVYGVNPDTANTCCNFVYESSDNTVVSVDSETGELTANGVGRARITVTADNNSDASAVCDVTVIDLSAGSLTVGIGDKVDLYQLINHPDGLGEGEYSFSSSNKKYAKVGASDGLLQGVKKGSANITIKNDDGLSVKLKVTVRSYAAASRVSISPDPLVLGVDMSGKLNVKFTSGYYGLYTLSTDSDCIELGADGSVHALKEGTALVTLTLEKNPQVVKTALVQVLPAPQVIQGSVPGLTLGVDQTSADFYGINPDADNSGCLFVYESSNTAAVEVNAETGEMKAVGLGEAIITVRAHNNDAAFASCRVNVKPNPETLALETTGITVGKGDSFDMDDLVAIDEGSAAGYTYASSKKSVATVDASGVIKGVKAGTANITVTTHNGLSAKLKVTVRTLATSARVSINPSKLTLGEGMGGKLNVKFSSGYYALHQWSTNDAAVATVDADGNIQAIGPGTATITVKLDKNSVAKSATVTVLPAPRRISASENALVMGVGQVSDALYGINPDPDNSMCDFIYRSTNEAAVLVDAATGELTAVGEGYATILINASNNPAALAACVVRVLDQPGSIALEESSMTIGKGETFDLKDIIRLPAGTAAGYTFSTSAKKYVTVDANGIIKGAANGSATITVKTHNGLSAKIKVTVKTLATASKMSISPSSLTLGEEMGSQLTLKFTSGYYGLYSWESDRNDIASVDENGYVRAVAPGTATITAKIAKNGASKSVTVTVLPAPESITASETKLELGLDQVSDALYGINPDPENSMCEFIYLGGDDVVRVDAQTGELTALAKGTATVRVYAKNNPAAYAECVVQVLDKPGSIELSETEMTIGKGDTFDLTELIRLPEGTAAGYTFSTSAKKYVTVSEDGEIKGAEYGGSSTITVKTHNDLSATIKVTVKRAPTKVDLTPDAIMLGVDMQQQLSVAFNSSSYYSLHSIQVEDESVASLDADGMLTAKTIGETNITVTTNLGLTDTTTLKVVPAPEHVEFAQTEYVLSEKMQLDTGIVVDENTMAVYSYASDDTGKVTIDANGRLTGVAAGTATITVTTHTGVTNQQVCTVTVLPEPATVDFNDLPSPMLIAKSNTFDLPVPFALDAEGDEVPATFTYSFTKSSFGDYAKISGSTITGKKAGTITVRAKAHNGVYADFQVKVVADTINRVELDYSSYALYINDAEPVDTVALNGRIMGSSVNFGIPEYVSSKPEVAEVSEDGIVTAVAPGETVITATGPSGFTAECTITVGVLSTGIAFDPAAHTVTEGDTYQLEPVFDEGTGARVKYVSSDPNTAFVDEASGLVTAMAPGSATITATTQNEKIAEVDLKILAKPSGIYLNVVGLNLVAGESVELKPQFQKDPGLEDDIEIDTSLSYASSMPAVATAESGVITALTEGETLITLTTCNGLTAECKVKVLPAGSTVDSGFAWTTATMINGDSAALELTLNKEAYERGFSISCDNEEALFVDDRNWTITATAPAPGGVKLTLIINPPEGASPAAAEEVSCVVKILAKSSVSFSEQEVVLKRGEADSSASLRVLGLPEDLIGTFELYVEDPFVAAYDAETETVQSLDLVGETNVICRLFDQSAACLVKVVPAYRALLISEFNNSKYTSENLPFAQSNIGSMYDTLYESAVDGQLYDITIAPNNPTQAQIQSYIANTFANAREGDVSLVYIVSHGYYSQHDISGYYFGTPGWKDKKAPDSYITASELMGWLEGIEGNVILMLDSCKSGGFIKSVQSRLDAAGNVAVITAQTYNKNASYFVKQDGSSIEFLTYVLCAAFGYDYEDAAFETGLLADSSKDGLVTVKELFNYTKSKVPGLVKEKASKYFYPGKKYGFLVPGVNTTSKLKSWGGQTPQIYIPKSMESLVIYG